MKQLRTEKINSQKQLKQAKSVEKQDLSVLYEDLRKGVVTCKASDVPREERRVNRHGNSSLTTLIRILINYSQKQGLAN